MFAILYGGHWEYTLWIGFQHCQPWKRKSYSFPHSHPFLFSSLLCIHHLSFLPNLRTNDKTSYCFFFFSSLSIKDPTLERYRCFFLHKIHVLLVLLSIDFNMKSHLYLTWYQKHVKSKKKMVNQKITYESTCFELYFEKMERLLSLFKIYDLFLLSIDFEIE